MFTVLISINHGPYEPYELGPIHTEFQAKAAVVRLTNTSKACGSDRRYKYVRVF